MNLAALKKKHGLLRLDIGAGEALQPGFIGMDKRAVKGIDVVHDIEVLPWPFPDNTFDTILASHIVEHLKPWLMIDVMNEAWRVMKVGGQMMIATPYAGNFYFHQDPTHVHGWNEATPHYYDPEQFLYQVYKPSPWHIEYNAWHQDGFLEVIFKKILSANGNGKR